jgi:hypothetical protein
MHFRHGHGSSPRRPTRAASQPQAEQQPRHLRLPHIAGRDDLGAVVAVAAVVHADHLRRELADDPSVKVWLGEVETRLYAFLAHTNFYGAAKTGYLEMGAFGTEACVMLEHPTKALCAMP